jgi:predicted lipoprotein
MVMNRQTLGILVLLATAFAVIVGAEQAKSQPKPAPKAVATAPLRFSGEIVAVDTQAHTFTVRSTEATAHDMKFRAESGAKVMVNGQAKSVRLLVTKVLSRSDILLMA